MPGTTRELLTTIYLDLSFCKGKLIEEWVGGTVAMTREHTPHKVTATNSARGSPYSVLSRWMPISIWVISSLVGYGTE